MTSPNVTTCPPEALLSDFGLGKLDAASAETIGQHLETCTDCRNRVASLPGDTFVGRLRQAGTAPSGDKHQRTYVPGESLANAANSTDGSSKEDGLPRPSRKSSDAKQGGPGGPSSISAPPELADHPDYELIKELGQGGMGTVYLAKNRMMDRPEVLKVISKSLLDRPGALERFQQEIRSAAKLQHTNIVAAYSVLRPGDLLVFAMEYVKGQDLSQVVKARGYLPVANAAFYIHQVANGLQHAHEKGMVHRDIKPNNLMLAVDGKKHVVKILDFGLAKATSEKGAESGLTKSGQMLGTPDYVAPEQTLDAHQADIRADIYSLGCTLYFLLSGGPPFQETSLYAILEAHHKRDPKPLNLVRPEVPVELAQVVARMMAKDPAKRFQTPLEVAKALVPFFKPGQTLAPPPTEKPPGEGEYPQYTTEMAERAPSTNPPCMIDQAAPHSPPPIGPPRTPFAVPVMPFATAPIAAATPLPAADPVEVLSLSIDIRQPTVKRRNGWSSLPPWQRWAALGGAAAALLLGVALLVRTPHGTVAIELSDPNAKVEVQVDGNNVKITGLDEPLYLQVGEHQLRIKGDGYETITKQFKVTRGKNAPLTVTLRNKEPAVDLPQRFACEIEPRFRKDWSVDGDELVGGSAQGDAGITFGPPIAGNYDFSVELKRVAGNDACSLMFGYNNDTDFYSYNLGAWRNTKSEAYREMGGRDYLASHEGSLAQGRWYRAELRVRGNRCECFLDGEKLFGFSAGALEKGRLGLYLWSSEYRFRNIVVKSPDGNVLLQGLPDLPYGSAAPDDATNSPPHGGPSVSSGDDSFVPLLNAEDLTGWGLVGAVRTSHVSVVNGELTAVNDDPKEVNYLLTDRVDYADFQFRCEFFATSDKDIVAVQVRTEPMPVAGGIRGYLLNVQRLEDAAPGGASCATTLALSAHGRDQYDLSRIKHRAPGAGGWHKLAIIVIGDQIKALIDGDVVADRRDEGRAFRSGALALLLRPKATSRLRKLEIREFRRDREPKPATGFPSRWANWRAGHAMPWHDGWRVYQQADEKWWIETNASYRNINRHTFSEVRRTPEFVDIERPNGTGKVVVRLWSDRMEDGPDFEHLKPSVWLNDWASMGPAENAALEAMHQRPVLDKWWTDAIDPQSTRARGVDLLRLIEPARDARLGTWQLIEGRLVGHARSYAQIDLPINPPEEYVVTAFVLPTLAEDPFFLGLPIGKSQVLVTLNTEKGQGAGLSLIDGRAATDNETTRPGSWLYPFECNLVECRVRKNQVQVTCNGVVAVNWTGDPGRLSLPQPWKTADKPRVFIGGRSGWLCVPQMLFSPLSDVESSARNDTLKPADGPIDLLKRVEPARDSILGEWRRDGDALTSPSGWRTRLQLPVVAPAHYRLTAVVSREGGKKDQGGSIVFGLPVGKYHTALSIDNANRPDPLVVLELVDGKGGSVANGTRAAIPKLPEGASTTVVCTVHPDRVSVQLDGKQVLDWHGDARRLSIDRHWSPADWSKPSLGTRCGVRFSKLQIEALGAESASESNTPGTEMSGAVDSDASPAPDTSGGLEISPTTASPPRAEAPFDAKQARAHQRAWAKHLGVAIEQNNSIGMKLVLIPPGEFTMGSTAEQIAQIKKISVEKLNDRIDEGWFRNRFELETPAHRVVLTRPCLFGATEVTVGQFRRFIDASGYKTEAERFGGGNSNSAAEKDRSKAPLNWRNPGHVITDNSNVSQVTRNDAIAFCNWLSEAEDLPPCYRQDANGGWLPEAAGSGYRLPTEAEWENACRAGTTTHHPFGDDPAMFPRHSRSGGQWWAFSKVQRPILVGLTPPNAFGLYDMDTNVYEWCQDGFSREFYAQSPPEDPVAPLSREGMIRGGEWAGRPFVRSRSAFREPTPPLTRREDIGFRVVRLTPAVVRRGRPARAAKSVVPNREGKP